MVYTINSGLQHRLRQKLVKVGGLGLPALALGFLIVAALSFSSFHSAGQQPYINKPQHTKSLATTSSKNPANDSSSSPVPNSASPQSAIGINSIPGNLLSAPLSSATVTSSPVLPGGMGGGDGLGGGSSGGGSTTPTVACTDLLTVSQLCTVCNPPLLLQPGQKALLSADGSCIAVN